MASRPLVDVVGVDKWFGSTHALRSVDLRIEAGQCLGLVGRNGAGKSTLVSILSGLVEPDAGTVTLGGEPAPKVGAVSQWREWIATVFQHSMVVPDLSVAENVFLGNTDRLVDWRRRRDAATAIMAEWGYDIPARALCRDLSVEQLQIVEIARALARGAKCVLLDEPTAALERDAVRRLFDRVRRLCADGIAVLYISHHLEEVFEICHDVAVLRDGEMVLTSPIGALQREDLISAMVGSRVAENTSHQTATRAGDPVLTIDAVTASSARGRLDGVSLTVNPGEVVGVTGLLSAGVATLGRVVAGAEAYDGGAIHVSGRGIVSDRRDLAQHAGVGYIPADRRAEGFVAHLGVAENVTMTIADRLAGLFGITRPERRAAAAKPLTDALSLVSSGPAQPVGELSGGNQQKVTVARTLAHTPDVVVAITPTRGVDVASKELLLGSLADVARTTGAGVLLCSDELSDLVHCDRVIVLVRGEIFTEFTERPFDRDALLVAVEGLVPTGSAEEAAR
jgi:simple sugar transport system ATP-binding protein